MERGTPPKLGSERRRGRGSPPPQGRIGGRSGRNRRSSPSVSLVPEEACRSRPTTRPDSGVRSPRQRQAPAGESSEHTALASAVSTNARHGRRRCMLSAFEVRRDRVPAVARFATREGGETPPRTRRRDGRIGPEAVATLVVDDTPVPPIHASILASHCPRVGVGRPIRSGCPKSEDLPRRFWSTPPRHGAVGRCRVPRPVRTTAPRLTGFAGRSWPRSRGDPARCAVPETARRVDLGRSRSVRMTLDRLWTARRSRTGPLSWPQTRAGRRRNVWTRLGRAPGQAPGTPP
jgi:hypothetical protein